MTKFRYEDQPLASREDQARQTILDHYESEDGRRGEDPFSILRIVRATPGLQMKDILATRQHYQEATSKAECEKIRFRIISTLDKAQRQGLVSKSGAQWYITDRGRQFVIAGIQSRASTFGLGNLSIEQACELCAEDELPGCHTQSPNHNGAWPSTIPEDLGRCISAWMAPQGKTRHTALARA